MSNQNLVPSKSDKPTSPVRLMMTGAGVQGALIPPVLKEVGKLAAGVAAVATGSATGNPRNKTALQPGHSLMDWIRLGSSGKDLTGVGARAGQISVTLRQLAEHNKRDDAWIAIRGKVFNVTYYLPFHPGGEEELMRGVGKDATTLFEEVHAWVNYESLLQKCYIGQLVAIDPSVDTEELFFGSSQNKTNLANKLSQSNSLKSSDGSQTLLPNAVVPITTSDGVSPNHDEKAPTSVAVATPSAPPKVEIAEVVKETLPRFDWIQKSDNITLIFYTKAFSNPEVEILPPNVNNVVNINLTYGNQLFVNEIKLAEKIAWPGTMKINYENGKIEVYFRKAESKIWDNFGFLKQKTKDIPVFSVGAKHQCTVVNKLQLSYNTCILELQLEDKAKMAVPIGKHIQVFRSIEGMEISRSYTPVPCSVFSNYPSPSNSDCNVALMVKSYPNGSISKYICDKKLGDRLEISKPLGNFNLQDVENRETFLLVAAGTGLTPMLGLLSFLLERRIRKCQNVTLLFFNRREEDILFRNQLENLMNEDDRFRVEHVLSQADSKWKGLRGHITRKIVEDAIATHLHNTVYKQGDIFATVCGPSPFTELSQTLLKDVGFVKDQIHLFQG